MSASREKKARQERGADYLSPKQQKALEEQKANRRTTAIFTACAAVFVVGVIAMLLWNSNIFQRNQAAVRVNGETYSAADFAYYYYNGRASLLANGSSSINSSISLREQDYTASDAYETWFDYLSEQAVRSLASSVLAAQAARDAGFDGGADVEQTVADTLASLESSAADNSYSVGQYLKVLYGPLMTRSVFERNVRTVALAEAYTATLSDIENYSDAELTAEYKSDPDAYSMVDYEYAVFLSSTYASDAGETEDAETADDGSASALAAAEDAAARWRAGENLETASEELEGSYAHTTSYYSTAELAAWLFDDARRDGDVTVLDYTYYGISLGSMTVVFHGKERADFYAVDVRHILVENEAAANDILAQYNAGDKTEDAFAALARENSSDNAEDGGLYAGVYLGQMVAPFEDWCFDASRRPGDTGIVQTDYGYHVMYFVAAHEHPYWQELAVSALGAELSDQIADSASTELLSGMKYIDA